VDNARVTVAVLFVPSYHVPRLIEVKVHGEVELHLNSVSVS